MIFHSNEIERLTIYVTNQFGRGKSLKVEPVTVTKTLSQLAYSWLVFTIISQETGYTKDEVYQFCLKKFPVHKEVTIGDTLTLIEISLSKMSKEQCSSFIDQFTTFFRTEGYSVPDPEDKRLRDLYNEYKERGLL
jgi:hypothetical protein